MGDRRYPPGYRSQQDFEAFTRNIRLLELYGNDVVVVPRNSLPHGDPLQRYTDFGRSHHYPFDDPFDFPGPSRGPSAWDHVHPPHPAPPPRVPPSWGPPVPAPRPQRPESRRNNRSIRERRHSTAVAAERIREEREAQERRDAEEAARLAALERQTAEDWAYAQALQFENSSDAGDSNVDTLPDRIWQPQSTPDDGGPSTNETLLDRLTSSTQLFRMPVRQKGDRLGGGIFGNLPRTTTEQASTARPSRPTPQTQDCAVCFCSYEYPADITHLACGHYYCTDCLSGLFAGAITGATSRLNPQPFPPSCCPDHPIAYHTVERHLSAAVRQTYLRHRALLETPSADRVWCGRADCGAFIAPSTVSAGIFGSVFADGRRRPAASNGSTLARCTACSTQTCKQCRRPADEHAGGAGGVCPEDADVKKLMAAARRRGWQQCYSCKSMVERTHGCDHMSCNCGAEFCYICGERWRSRQCPHSRRVDDDDDEV